MTMYDARTNLSQQVVQDVKNYFQNKVKVYESVIPRNVRLGEAPSFGKPIAYMMINPREPLHTAAGSEVLES